LGAGAAVGLARPASEAGRIEAFSYHDSAELGQTQLRFVAKKFGLSLDELKRLL